MHVDSMTGEFDLVLVGGGLQNALLALSVLERQPKARIALIEQAPRVGGNHTWSFHGGDVGEEPRALVDRLAPHQWPAYDVAFPGFTRTLAEPYGSMTSERLASVVEGSFGEAPGAVLLAGIAAESIGASRVTLADGRTLEGRLIVDARGPTATSFGRVAGYQKFVGLELALEKPHHRARPMLMDACVPQDDGFRFFYVLPLDARRLLVEDTYFSDSPSLDVPALRRAIHAYAAHHGYAVSRVVREEVGVLPLPAAPGPSRQGGSPILAGYGGGFFHPATGYSFPVALRLARHVAREWDGDTFGEGWRRLVDEHRSQFRFAALLNRMLFGAFLPENRWNALARFYRLPADTIRRFYALETTAGDRLRILCGRPPRGISLRAAIGAMP
jgi:lycopene beta-cyclase